MATMGHHPDQVRVIETLQGGGLTVESPNQGFVGGQMRMQHLDGHRTATGFDGFGPPDHPPCRRAEFIDKAPLAEAGTGFRQPQRRRSGRSDARPWAARPDPSGPGSARSGARPGHS